MPIGDPTPGGSTPLDWQRFRRTVTVAFTIATVLAVAGSASGETAVQRARRNRLAAEREITQLQRDLLRADRIQARQVPLSGVLLARLGPRLDDQRLRAIRSRGRRHETDRLEAWDTYERRVRARIQMLRTRRAALGAWLWTYGVFEVCPVPGYTVIHDDFGEIVRLPKVPVHRHLGSDISAPTWAPIRAPFDGYASGSQGVLGGIEVRIRGVRGHVYNAHLIAYGRLGWVKAGEVIGYVGSTGDATGPHDHLEWHPYGGSAVDPYALLAAACLPV